MDESAPKHYFLAGIGGIGMQALADVLLGMGHTISGSNIEEFPERGRLEAKGIKVYVGEHQAKNVASDVDELIYTSAIPRDFPNDDHPELVRARELGIPTTKRSKFIGKLMADKVGIAVSGTHGKTTTATLLTMMLQEGDADPTALIGAEVKSLKGCGLVGGKKYMVVEACEYDRSFLDMQPKIAVLTNIEEDHLDYYRDIDEIKEAFGKFLSLVPKDGLAVVCGDDPNIQDIIHEAKSQVIKFGFGEDNDLRAHEVEYKAGKMHFKADGIKASLNFPGRHLVLDALAAMAVAKHLGVDDRAIVSAISKFKGARRRFEILGEKNGVTFIDDYGHHPTEIKAMLASLKDYFGERNIKIVFQPHQFSRTRLLLAGFAKSFAGAKEVLVAPILPVRDSAEERKSISAEDLAKAIDEFSHNARAIESFEAASSHLRETLKPGDVLLSLGAGKNSDWIRGFYETF